MKMLDACYEKALHGIPGISMKVEDLARDYLSRHANKEKACKAMIRNQTAKCTTSGFLTGFGGLITLPVAIPANIGSVIVKSQVKHTIFRQKIYNPFATKYTRLVRDGFPM